MPTATATLCRSWPTGDGCAITVRTFQPKVLSQGEEVVEVVDRVYLGVELLFATSTCLDRQGAVAYWRRLLSLGWSRND